MKPLLKIILLIATFFATTFLLIKLTGVLTIDQIKGWLLHAKELSPIYVGGIVSLLLFLDLFIAVPTLTITILAGYFLGFGYGILASLLGMTLAGLTGYFISRYYGKSILGFLVKEESKRNEVIKTFQKHGFVMILLSRAMPIIPETTACLAGMTRMNFNVFFIAWLISSVPYTLIASYAGSISSIDNPKPAIFAAIGITVLLWIFWYLFHRIKISKKT